MHCAKSTDSFLIAARRHTAHRNPRVGGTCVSFSTSTCSHPTLLSRFTPRGVLARLDSHSLVGAPRGWDRATKGEGHGCGAHPRATPNTPRAYARNLALRPRGPTKDAPQPAQLTPALVLEWFNYLKR